MLFSQKPCSFFIFISTILLICLFYGQATVFAQEGCIDIAECPIELTEEVIYTATNPSPNPASLLIPEEVLSPTILPEEGFEQVPTAVKGIQAATATVTTATTVISLIALTAVTVSTKRYGK